MRSPRLNFNFLIKHPANFLALGFGSGLSPIAPGTAGTIAAIPIYLLVQTSTILVYLAIIGILSIIGIWICDVPTKQLNYQDHPGIVWDEICGYLLTMAWVPVTWPNILLGFILFRIFDIWKPWPICWVEQRYTDGLGIMLDDLAAAIPAGIILFISAILWPCWFGG